MKKKVAILLTLFLRYTGNQNLPNDGSGLGYGTWANSQGAFGTNSFPYIDFNLYKDVNLYLEEEGNKKKQKKKEKNVLILVFILYLLNGPKS
jgi:hypothetical protein